MKLDKKTQNLDRQKIKDKIILASEVYNELIFLSDQIGSEIYKLLSEGKILGEEIFKEFKEMINSSLFKIRKQGIDKKIFIHSLKDLLDKKRENLITRPPSDISEPRKIYFFFKELEKVLDNILNENKE
ncbi:MAG: hypothetical protein ABIF17_04765 [Patescibacteria group bacterium]